MSLNKSCLLANYGYDQRSNASCCWMPKSASNNTPSSFMNSKNMQEVRLSLANNHKHPDCAKCWQDEDNGKVSKRQSMTRQSEIAHYWEQPELQVGDLVYLSLYVGNKCNLACRTCGSHSSTSWIKEQQYTQSKGYDQSAIRGSNVVKKFSIDSIDVPLDKLRHIEVLGGEPFYELDHLAFLERVLTEADPSEITLFYSTNGTKKIDPDIQQMFSKFKKVIISFSLDAIGKPFEYIRTLGKWEQVEDVLEFWKTQPNVQLQNHCTMSILNIMNIKQLAEYLTEKQNFQPWQLGYTYASQPQFFNYSVIDDHKKSKHNVAQHLEYSRHTDSIRSYFNNAVYSQENYNDFLKQLNITSEFRKLDIQDYLPDLCRILEI